MLKRNQTSRYLIDLQVINCATCHSATNRQINGSIIQQSSTKAIKINQPINQSISLPVTWTPVFFLSFFAVCRTSYPFYHRLCPIDRMPQYFDINTYISTASPFPHTYPWCCHRSFSPWSATLLPPASLTLSDSQPVCLHHLGLLIRKLFSPKKMENAIYNEQEHQQACSL